MQRYRLAFATAKRGAWVGGILASWKALVSSVPAELQASWQHGQILAPDSRLGAAWSEAIMLLQDGCQGMADHSILDIWACWSRQLHLSCRQAAHQRLRAP